MAGSNKALLVVVSGVVQGVDLRKFVRRVDERWRVKGYVKNLYDGSVDAYAEGEESAVKAFLEEVRIGPSHAHVSGIKVEWMEYKGKYGDFRIEL